MKKGVYSVDEIELIKRRYSELVQEGLNDRQISNKICKELKRNALSVGEKMRRMREDNEIGENKNNQDKKRYTNVEIELIKRRYIELVREGLGIFQIAKKIGGELGRSANSVASRIKKMRENGELPENPNNRDKKDFSEDETELIKSRYVELIEEGLSYRQIGEKIAKELERSASSVVQKIRRMREDREIGENPNKYETKGKYTADEIKFIKKRYTELVQEGLNNEKIGKIIGKDLCRSSGSIKEKIRKMRKNGDILENPNKQKTKIKFTEYEIELIKRRYAEFIEEGLLDSEISRRLGEELGRSASSVEGKIRKLKRAGELADAEALREREDILGVARALEEFGEDDG